MPVSNISEARKAASRANGGKSRGPITSTGKARSSMNALRHGATMKALLLTDECKEAAMEVIEEYVTDLNPQGAVERDIVEMIALHHWQYNRVQSRPATSTTPPPGTTISSARNSPRPIQCRAWPKFFAT